MSLGQVGRVWLGRSAVFKQNVHDFLFFSVTINFVAPGFCFFVQLKSLVKLEIRLCGTTILEKKIVTLKCELNDLKFVWNQAHLFDL